MLLRFTVANHLSFKSHQELIFATSKLEDDPDGLIPCKAVPIGSVLPAAVIYGANASGKSNFVDAIANMRNFVLRSHFNGKPDDRIFRNPFRLDPTCLELPSVFEVDFMIDDVRYHYGFEVTDKVFVAEWLYAFPTSRSRMMFERDRSNFKFGRELKGHNKTIVKVTTPNSLFLSTAAQYGHQQLIAIHEYFKSIEISRSVSIRGAEFKDRYFGDTLDPRVISFLKLIGTGVVGHQVIKSKITNRKLVTHQEIDAIINHCYHGLSSVPRNNELVAVELAHLDSNGEQLFFDIDSVGAGTRRLLMLLSAVFQALDEGTLLCIDEIETSLHTLVTEAILQLFCTPEINRKGAQLIATTHDTNLMGSSALRRDQIWFTEKRRDSATRLYSLSDYRTHKDDDFELGYLQGRFGAAPDDDFVWQFHEES